MKKTTTLFALVLISILLTAYSWRLESIGWYLWHNHLSPNTKSSEFHLANYTASVNAKPLPGLDDASGLTYHTPSNTLFTVLNQEPKIVQISTDGEILNTIEVIGVKDMEGITHVHGNQFIIVEESKNRLILVELNENQKRIDVSKLPQLTLSIDLTDRNKNFEGITWDESNNRILVVKERNPKQLLEIKGFVNADGNAQNQNVSIQDLTHIYPFLHSMRDLASITFHDESGHLVLLSEESKLIKEYNREGQAVSAMLLWKGFHGLSKAVPQAEGIAIGPDKKIYIISEPNLLYVFSPT
ncbi:MAG TPA: SdiA-regulated domain-containing protein [Methylotenera sp.]